MFENFQGIKPMGFSASLDDKKKLHKHENVTNIINTKQKNQGIYPMGLCYPWGNYSINNQKSIKT